MRLVALIAALCLFSSPAVAKPSCGEGGPTGEGSAQAGAGTYRYNVPANYTPAQVMPLLLALHGDEGKPDYIYSVWKNLQLKQGGAYILVAPKAPFGGGSWYQSTAKHTEFIDAVLDVAQQQWNIDQDRIWITGWSGGATFLGNYVTSRQDRLAAVVFYLGAGGAWLPYSPPAGSCKIPARFVCGSKDFLKKSAQELKGVLDKEGHETIWVELPGVGHDFRPETLPETWSWLSAHTLCGTTTPGSCGPLSPDLGPSPREDAGVMPSDAWAPQPTLDAGGDTPALPNLPASPPQDATGGELVGSCSVAAAGSAGLVPPALLLLLLLGARARRYGREERGKEPEERHLDHGKIRRRVGPPHDEGSRGSMTRRRQRDLCEPTNLHRRRGQRL